MSKVNIAIFAGGTGSNAFRIDDHFKNHSQIQIAALYCNVADAPVVSGMQQRGVPVVLFNRQQFYKEETIAIDLKRRQIDFVVLAGFMWLIPLQLIKLYDGKMLNVHPSKLPAFGGKGMYGMHVHEAVIASGMKSSGITIHYVNEYFDEGRIVHQVDAPVLSGDSPQQLAERIKVLEHFHYPKVIESEVTKHFQLKAHL
ncbi:MAG: phosphoribosylglycinamide formyltransferase [Bacteroidota bacterium]|jgi:phosphoribosylglycinamide formyltransferase 1